MAQIINITDKLSNDKPVIVIGDKEYPVHNDMETIFKFEELQSAGTQEALRECVELTLGKTAAKALKIEKMSLGNFKVLVTAIFAAASDITFEEAASRFQI